VTKLESGEVVLGNSFDQIEDIVNHKSGPIEESVSLSIVAVNSLANSVSSESSCNEHKTSDCAIVANHRYNSPDISGSIPDNLKNADVSVRCALDESLNLDLHNETVFEGVPSIAIGLEQQMVSTDHQGNGEGACSRQMSNLSLAASSLTDRLMSCDADDLLPLEIGNDVSMQHIVYMLVFNLCNYIEFILLSSYPKCIKHDHAINILKKPNLTLLCTVI